MIVCGDEHHGSAFTRFTFRDRNDPIIGHHVFIHTHHNLSIAYSLGFFYVAKYKTQIMYTNRHCKSNVKHD